MSEKQKIIYWCWDTNYIFVYISSLKDEEYFDIYSEDCGNASTCCLWML